MIRLRNVIFPLESEGITLQVEDFDFQILESVTKVLDSYGSAIRDKVFWHLFFYCGVKPSEIGEKIGTFIKALQTVLGTESVEIEESISLELKKRFRIPKSVPSQLIPVLSAISNGLVVV